MAQSKLGDSTRPLYASIREDIYLAAKARATELRVPMKEFLEKALKLAILEGGKAKVEAPSIWDDEYLGIQARQELGSPVELTRTEAEKVVRGSFGIQGPNSSVNSIPASDSLTSPDHGEGHNG